MRPLLITAGILLAATGVACILYAIAVAAHAATHGDWLPALAFAISASVATLAALAIRAPRH